MWKLLENSLYYLPLFNNKDECKKFNNIIMFDLDHCLIKPTKNKKFPLNKSDWVLLFDNVITVLNNLIKNNYYVAIISNQSGIEKRKFLLDRISDFLNKSNVMIDVYVASKNDIFRKPNTKIFEKYIYPKINENYENLIFVGDAAGRPDDFSDSDRKFAYNIHLFLKYKQHDTKIKFYTPEEYFKDEFIDDNRSWSGFDPSNYLKTVDKQTNEYDKLINYIREHVDEQFLIILIGPPCSGKTYVTNKIIKLFPNFIEMKGIISNKNLKKNMDENRSIIINNNNPSKKSREKYVDKLQHDNLKIIYINMDTFLDKTKNKELYLHINIYKERINYNNDIQYERIPELVYNIYYKNYTNPNDDNINAKIFTIKFIPKFKTKLELLYFLQKS